MDAKLESQSTRLPGRIRRQGWPRGKEAIEAGEALARVREHSFVKFNESLEIAVGLNFDTKKGNIVLRGSVDFPHGIGKKIRVAVFARGAKAQEALDAGATIVGADELIKQIREDKIIEFDRALATPDMMGLVGSIARILGPRGLMPNPKLGNITNDIGPSVKALLAGQVSFKTDKHGFVMLPCGKLGFSDEQLMENLRAAAEGLYSVRPDNAKPPFFRQAFLSSTMGPGIPVDLKRVLD